MRILIVSPVYPPEPLISSQTSSQLAKALADSGHSVTVLTTFPNRPMGKLYAGYKRRLWVHDPAFTDYEVFRCFSLISFESGVLSRFLENVSFGLFSGVATLFLGKPDVIYGNTWPIFAQGILAIVCSLRGIPLVMSVQDVYPESLVVQSRVGGRDGWLVKFLRWLDIKNQKKSAALVVISKQFREIYVKDRGIPADRIHLIPNWMDEKKLQVEKKEHTIRRMHAIPEDSFLVVYAGNVGAAAGMETVIRAFGNLIAEENIHLLIAGSGSTLSKCRELAKNIGNPRICFHSPWLEAETSSLLAEASLCILPTRMGQSMVSVPSKLMSYMFVGRPILACVDEKSEIALIIRDAVCGWVIPPDDVDVLAQKILCLSKYAPDELQKFGNRGRDHAHMHMSMAANLPKLVGLIEEISVSRF